MESEILTIDPRGEVVQTYFKNRPVPGDGRIPVLDTPLGRRPS